MSNQDINQAKEWAKESVYFDDSSGFASAVRVIQSLPDQWLDAEKVRELLDRWAANPFPTSDEVAVLNDVEALLAQSLPTLAELIEQGGNQEDYAFRWVDTEDGVQLITLTNDECVYTLDSRGYRFGRDFHEVTPLPDLPRLEWPAQEPHPEYRPNYGPITLTPPTREEEAEVRKQFEEPALPRPEDVPDGEPWIVLCDGKKWVGVRPADSEYVPWSAIRMDGLDHQGISDSEITLVSRLVPEVGA